METKPNLPGALESSRSFSRRTPASIRWRFCAAVLCLAMPACRFDGKDGEPAPGAGPAGIAALKQNSDAASAQAFLAAYSVFMSPRCVNCHPVGDAPLQGDDSHAHAQNVKRGPDGRGKFGLKCAACHQDANLPGGNMPPGNPNWHLLPPENPMVFEGKSPGDLARQLKDRSQNGGKSLEALFHHIAEDALVLWGWNPGDGRTRPPLSHAEFVASMRTWIDGGAAIPE